MWGAINVFKYPKSIGCDFRTVVGREFMQFMLGNAAHFDEKLPELSFSEHGRLGASAKNRSKKGVFVEVVMATIVTGVPAGVLGRGRLLYFVLMCGCSRQNLFHVWVRDWSAG
ncbi:hypothetical protein PspS35_09210 [Pseudomonas sp. S35]|nr:hypothetical protein PspS35_09210 [Pseudomonas sp. S35]